MSEIKNVAVLPTAATPKTTVKTALSGASTTISLPKNIARVFPRKTKASPTDPLAFFSQVPHGVPDYVDTVHVSCAFTYDMPKAEKLVELCERHGFKVELGGPAYPKPKNIMKPEDEIFVPGMYLAEGYVITSRGCNRKCPHCSVPVREGKLRELPITHGWNILDDNILGCSPEHIRCVFEMLKSQPKRPIFSGGLEAALLKPWHIELLSEVNVERMYFAYDTPCDYEPLVEAGRLLRAGGISHKSQKARAYVLVGHSDDTPAKAEKRLYDTWKAGFFPYTMMFRDTQGVSGSVDLEWRKFLKYWERPQTVYGLLKATGIDLDENK